MARRRKTPQYYYNGQKQSAKARGIEWLFTFETWWEVWERSGKYDKRGCRTGQYVMARHGDTGPYAPWNVSIVEAGKNNADGMKEYQNKKKSGEYPVKGSVQIRNCPVIHIEEAKAAAKTFLNNERVYSNEPSPQSDGSS
jgi:hypothetical protein